MQTTTIALANEDISARLSSRQYDKKYTPVPNDRLPEVILEPLKLIYSSLTGNDLPLTLHTIGVVAQEGIFKRVVTPQIARFYLQETDEENGVEPVLGVIWGEERLPFKITEDGKITGFGTPKLGIKFEKAKVGRYEEVCMKLQAMQNKTLVVMPVKITHADWENKVDADAFGALYDQEGVSLILEHIAINKPLTDEERAARSNFVRLEGPRLKAPQIPIGEYTVTAYAPRGSHNKLHLQTTAIEPFTATIRVNVDGEWKDEERSFETGEPFRVECNTKLGRAFGAKPKVSEQSPAYFKVTGYGEWNSFPTATIEDIRFSGYVEDETLLKMDF